MPEKNSPYPLLFDSQWKARALDAAITAIDVHELCREYAALRANAPRRSSHDKPYFVGHSGTTSSNSTSNRLEEHYAIALLNLRRNWPRPDGSSFSLLDYQVPLKSNSSDKGVGKIDLLGITDQGRLIVLELKVIGQGGGRSNSPPSALMEGLRYSAMIEADFDAIAREVECKYGVNVTSQAPIVMLIAPQSYWRSWLELKPTGDWGTAFGELAAAITVANGVTIECMALEDVVVAYGLNGGAPRLAKVPSLTNVQLGKQPTIGAPLTSPVPAPLIFTAYRRNVQDVVWNWAEEHHKGQLKCGRQQDRSPVLNAEYAEMNVLVAEGFPGSERARSLISEKQRHKHFTSLRSSQAVAQSVFGAVSVLDRLNLLEKIFAECGRPAFSTNLNGCSLGFEHDVDNLGEPRPTSIDVLLSGERVRVATECKFTEEEFGTCSRPRLTPDKPNYAAQRCDGNYKAQAGRTDRCPLTTIGVRYWNLLPSLFDWPSDHDHSPCQFGGVYQLARNALAATISRDGSVNPRQGHVLVVYDANNPAFQFGGEAHRQWEAAHAACLVPGLIRRLSWQRLLSELARDSTLATLAQAVKKKYGF